MKRVKRTRIPGDPGAGPRLQEEMDRLGLTALAVKNLTGAQYYDVKRWLLGTAYPNLKHLRQLTDAGADLLYLVKGQRSVFGSYRLVRVE